MMCCGNDEMENQEAIDWWEEYLNANFNKDEMTSLFASILMCTVDIEFTNKRLFFF